MVTSVECAAHRNVDTALSCTACSRAICEACAAYEIDGRPACEACGAREGDRSRSLGTSLLVLVGAGYLATLALGVLVFKARPFVGGLAAIVAIALGRTLQLALRPRAVARRERAASTTE